MDAIYALKNRRSVRKFKDEVVPRSVMEEVIELVRFAPSWANSQTARWTLIDCPETIQKLANDAVKGFVYNMETLKNAKGVAILSFVRGKSGKLEKYNIESADTNKWEIFDAGIAAQTFCLSCFAHGVATCVFGVIDETTIGEIIGLPEEETVAALFVYGYAETQPDAPARKERGDILRFL